MIRYPIIRQELEARIAEAKASWLSRAKQRTEYFRKRGEDVEPPKSFWNEIKEVYRELQHDKCAYCERRIGGGKSEKDIEHFRPKRGVEDWSDVAFPCGGDFADGYYLLAYHPFNYLASCLTCNRERKQNYFPIAGNRISGADDPKSLVAERPYLIYPLGDIDDDPETLIRFVGILPVPVAQNNQSHQYRRAQVTIELFDLLEREDLLRERSEIVANLFLALRAENSANKHEREMARSVIAYYKDSASQHANCARRFCELYHNAPRDAYAEARKANEYLESKKL